MRWRLILEEYSPELIYIKGTKNIPADALSRLELVTDPEPIKADPQTLAEQFAIEKEDLSHPTSYKSIMKSQQLDKTLIETAKLDKKYSIKHFHGADKKYSLICRNNKIVIPKDLQEPMVQWYHKYLSHPGTTRTELTIAQHFYWKGLRNTVHDVCSKCEACQFLKRRKGNVIYSCTF